MTPLAASGLLTAMTCFPLALFICLRGPRTTLSQLMALFNTCVGVWGIGTMLAGLAITPQSAIWSWRFAHVGGWPLGMVFYHVSSVMTERSATWRIRGAYAFAVIAIGLCVSGIAMSQSQWLFQSLQYHQANSVYSVLLLIWSSIVVVGHYQLWVRSNDVDGIERTHLRFVFFAMAIGFLGGTSVLWPMFGLRIYPYGNFSIPVYALIVTYAILRYQFLDIRIVVRKGLVYSLLVGCITAAYLVMVLVMERWFQGFIGYRSFVATIVVAALIAMFFNPLRNRIQDFVDRALFKATPVEMASQLERLLLEVRKSDQMKAVAVLAAGMAHEIKNPLTAIKTFAEYVPEQGHDPAFQQKFQRIVTNEVDRIDRIVRSLLDFAKPAPLQSQPVLICHVLDETLDFLAGDCTARGVELKRVYQYDKTTIAGDAQQLRQVFLNLILNGLEAMNGGGTLTVSAAVLDHALHIRFEDTGDGIAPEHLKHIWDPFFTTKPKGTGLGLAIVQDIVEEHGGEITVESTPGLGTRFSLIFPVPSQNTPEFKTCPPNGIQYQLLSQKHNPIKENL